MMAEFDPQGADIPAPAPIGQPDVASYIRTAAQQRGIDPSTAVRVYQGEGGDIYTGDQGSSFGPYKLHYGGIAPGGNAVPGLGDEFTKATGLNARDPSTWKRQIDFSLDNVAKEGWGAFHAAKRLGIGEFSGVPASALEGQRERSLSGPRASYEAALGQQAPPPTETPNILDYTKAYQQQHNKELMQGQLPLFKTLLFGAMALVLGLGKHTFGKSLITMEGFAGFTKGLEEGDQERAAAGLANYKQGVEAMLDQYRLADKNRSEILQNQELDIGRKLELLKVEASAWDDKQTAALLDKKDLAGLDKLQFDRQQQKEKLQLAIQKAEDIHANFLYKQEHTEDKELDKEIEKAQAHADHAMDQLIAAKGGRGDIDTATQAHNEALERVRQLTQKKEDLARAKQPQPAAQNASEAPPPLGSFTPTPFNRSPGDMVQDSQGVVWIYKGSGDRADKANYEPVQQ